MPGSLVRRVATGQAGNSLLLGGSSSDVITVEPTIELNLRKVLVGLLTCPRQGLAMPQNDEDPTSRGDELVTVQPSSGMQDIGH